MFLTVFLFYPLRSSFLKIHRDGNLTRREFEEELNTISTSPFFKKRKKENSQKIRITKNPLCSFFVREKRKRFKYFGILKEEEEKRRKEGKFFREKLHFFKRNAQQLLRLKGRRRGEIRTRKGPIYSAREGGEGEEEEESLRRRGEREENLISRRGGGVDREQQRLRPYLVRYRPPLASVSSSSFSSRPTLSFLFSWPGGRGRIDKQGGWQGCNVHDSIRRNKIKTTLSLFLPLFSIYLHSRKFS